MCQNCHGIRECGSTLYVGLARAVPTTHTNFRLTFLLTRLQEVLNEDLAVQVTEEKNLLVNEKRRCRDG